MKTFRNEVQRMWLWALRRRSQRSRWTWDKFLEKLGNLLPKSKFCILTPMYALRQTTRILVVISEVRTVCVRSASTDLCGGCRVTGIPTATV